MGEADLRMLDPSHIGGRKLAVSLECGGHAATTGYREGGPAVAWNEVCSVPLRKEVLHGGACLYVMIVRDDGHDFGMALEQLDFQELAAQQPVQRMCMFRGDKSVLLTLQWFNCASEL